MLFRSCILFIAILLVACSNGGGDDPPGSGNDPEKPGPTSGDLILGGRILGLQGSLVLSSGKESKIFSSAQLYANGFGSPDYGAFLFSEQFDAGEEYNVTIESKPENQICEVRNSKSVIITDRTDVQVLCANLSEIIVRTNLPRAFEVADVYLTSNYAQAGRADGEELNLDAQALLAFDNSYVALMEKNANGDDKVIFLSYIDDVAKQNFEMDAYTTAIALLLMEPTIVSALLERQISAANLISALQDIDNTNVTNAQRTLLKEIQLELVDLDGKIYSLTREDATLENMGDSLQLELTNLVNISAEFISTFTHESLEPEIPVEIPDNPDAPTPDPIDYIENIDNSGISVVAGSSSNQESGLGVTVQNLFSRSLVIESNKFEQERLVLEVGNEFFDLPNGIAAQDLLTLTLFGPGSIEPALLPGEEEPFDLKTSAAFKLAVTSSGIHKHLLQSINMMLGLSDPGGFDMTECLLKEDFDSYIGNVANSLANDSPIFSGDYYHGYVGLFKKGREDFIDFKIDDENLLDLLFKCDKFGSGTFFSDRIAIAKSNVENLLGVANAMYGDFDLGEDHLFKIENMTRLTYAIDKTSSRVQWRRSNELNLSVDADKNQVVVGEEISLTAECKDNVDTVIECEVEWDLGDNSDTQQGLMINHQYLAGGEYTVTANAKIEEGATTAETVAVQVSALAPVLSVSRGGGIINNDGGSENFGDVQIGNSHTIKLDLKNIGNADLVIEQNSIFTNAMDYTASLVGEGTIEPEDERELEITFTPSSAGEQEAVVFIESNAVPEIFKVNVIGSGFGETNNKLPPKGGWTTRRGDQNSTFGIQRVIPQFNSGAGSEDDFLLVRLYTNVDDNEEYPQITLKLVGYKPTLEKLQFSLDDQGSNTCNGFFAGSGPDDAFCTVTDFVNSTIPLTGQVLLTVDDNNAKIVKMDFDFNAAQERFFCDETMDASKCERVSVNGTTTFELP